MSSRRYLLTLVATIGLLSGCGGGSWSFPSDPVNFQVGRTTVEWTDHSRVDKCPGELTNQPRRLQAHVWYPASPNKDAQKSPVFDATQAGVLSQIYGISSQVVAAIPSGSYVNASMSKDWKSHPVLIITHGAGGGFPLLYSSTAESLAAAGYVVLGLSHPHHTLVTSYNNGDLTTLDPKCDPMGATPEVGPGSTFEQFTANWNYKVALSRYLAADVRSTISQLKVLNLSHPMLAGRLEVNRVGVWGHSFGGSHAFSALVDLPEVVAAANIDGTVFSNQYATGVGSGKALLTLLGSDNFQAAQQEPARIAALQLMGLSSDEATEVARRGQPYVIHKVSKDSELVNLPTAKHMNFTDLGLWAKFGIPVDPDTLSLSEVDSALDQQRRLLLKFFDEHLWRW